MEHPNVQSGDSRAALSSKLGSLLNRDRLRVELRATLLDLRSRSSTLQHLLSFEIHRTVVALKQRFWLSRCCPALSDEYDEALVMAAGVDGAEDGPSQLGWEGGL